MLNGSANKKMEKAMGIASSIKKITSKPLKFRGFFVKKWVTKWLYKNRFIFNVSRETLISLIN